MTRTLTLAEIERIFQITDALGLSREALVIPLRPQHPGSLTRRKDGRLEIVVEAETSFDGWLQAFEAELRRFLGSPAGG